MLKITMTAVTVLIGLSAASQSAAAQALHPCIGSYSAKLQFVEPNAVRPYMVTIMADGNVIASPPGAVSTFLPGGAEVEYSSPSHGVWEKNTETSCRITLEALDAYPDGRVSGISRASIDFSVGTDGITIAGKAIAMKPDRELLGELSIKGQASRLAVDR